MKTCCFTGSRDLSDFDLSKLKAALEKAIDDAISDGYSHFIAGNAVGIDTMAAQIVLQKKELDSRLILEIAIPFEGHNAHIEEVAEIQKKADLAHVVTNKRNRTQAFFLRNRYMVDHSERVIAGGNFEKGGTKRTVDYARLKNKEVELIRYGV